jgi:hypothetical protein
MLVQDNLSIALHIPIKLLPRASRNSLLPCPYSPLPSDGPLAFVVVKICLVTISCSILFRYRAQKILCMFIGGIAQESQGCQVLMQAYHAVRFGSQTSGLRLDFCS